MFVWWRDVLRESTLEGHHTKVVQLGPRYGFILFIVSEVMFFFAFFRASSHSSLAPTVEIGGIWPPKGIGVLDPWEIPFLNTLIPLSSGAAVTWAHHAILAGKEKRAVYALVATVLLALVFTGFQGMEYYQAPSTISDRTFCSKLKARALSSIKVWNPIPIQQGAGLDLAWWYRHKTLIPAASLAKDLPRPERAECFFTGRGTVPKPESRGWME
ncbi:Cytochrome [Forsythia ovata]|uniref:Cytochrome c oxidase subunit 3 n=1 Tax=Forsythia ovata TaxID=205694 RepID=A0ABD1P2Y6_9LAMI